MDVNLTADDLVVLNRAWTLARLLSGAVHEVNNALLVVSGSAELLESVEPTKDALDKSVARIRSQTDRASGVLRGVMQFAQADVEEQSRLNLVEVVRRASSFRRYATSRAGITMTEKLPDAGVVVQGNPTLLLQVVLNLITNAEQALAGTRGGTIVVECRADTTTARVEVSDSGDGVPADQRQHIFEPFVTLRSRTRHSGLGLPAAQRIAQQHGGALGLAEDGRTFVLTLPVLAS